MRAELAILSVVTVAVASVTSAGCGGDDDKRAAGGTAGSAGAAGRGGSGGSAGTGGSGGSSAGAGGTAGGGGADAGSDAASDARPDGCPIARLGCDDLGKAIDGSGFNASTNVLRVVLLRGSSDIVSGSVTVSLPGTSGSCTSEEVTITAPVSVDTGALQVDLSSHGIEQYISNHGGFSSCGPAVFTLADQCGDTHVIEVEASYFTEGGTLRLTCAPADGGPDAGS